MRDLKPCPFCSSARIALLPPERIIEPWFVICDQHETCPAPSNFYATREEAVEAWNTRPREDALTEEVEALRAALTKAREGLSIAAGWARSKPDSGNARDKIKAGLEAIRFALNPRAAPKGKDR